MKFEALSPSGSKTQIAAVATQHVRLLGFDYWTYSVTSFVGSSRASDWSLHNFPDEDAARACARLTSDAGHGTAEHSYDRPRPWTARAATSAWMLPDASTLPTEPPAGPRLPAYEAARRLGVRGGLSLPVYDATGMGANLTLVTCQPISLDALDAASMQAQVFSKYLHEACRAHILDAQRGIKTCLSSREVECLTWASKGKTSWEIGRVLGISEHTAIFHLRNAKTKLGTANRQQAVARSVQLGLVAA